MKAIITIILCLSFCFQSFSQLDSIGFELIYVHPDEIINDFAFPDGQVNLNGYYSWQLYAYCQNPDDFVSAVVGDVNIPTSISIDNTASFFQHPIGPTTGPVVSDFFIFFPTYQYDSFVSIDLLYSTDYIGETTGVNVIQDVNNPWIELFESGESIEIDSFVGGAWFSIPGNANGVAGDDLKVLLGQFTANSDIRADICVQTFPHGIPPSDNDYDPVSCHSAEAITGVGCTDTNACNFNVNAEIDNGSCLYTIYVCEDETALNYLEERCGEPVPCINIADLNKDGFVNMTDLTFFLVNFGDLCSPSEDVCFADFNGDHAVTTSDLTILLINMD